MFNRLAEIKAAFYTPVPVLDDEYTCDNFHPDIFELATLKKSVFAE